MGSEGDGGILFLDVCLDWGVDLGWERDGGILFLDRSVTLLESGWIRGRDGGFLFLPGRPNSYSLPLPGGGGSCPCKSITDMVGTGR